MLPWFNTPSASASAERFNDVRDTSLSKLVKGDVLGLILSGVLVPGQRINEPDVATRLQVSRVPVREALRELESQGLVVARKHAGVFVRQLAPDEIRDLYQMRGLLDGFAGRCAARLPAERRMALLQVLDASVSVMRAAASQHDVQRYYAENLHFHWAIVEAAGNRQLSDTYLDIVQKLHLSRLKNLSHDLGIEVSLAEHADIVQVLRNADASRCETMLAQHVGDAYERLLAHKTSQDASLDEPASA
ncbi:MAG: GntR family transcriptional regulator [Polaromonas sp.]